MMSMCPNIAQGPHDRRVVDRQYVGRLPADDAMRPRNLGFLLAGFAGTVFSRAADQGLGLACVRAWNDWHDEVWAGTYPERIVPLQIPWLSDPVVAADEVRRNAGRGFKAVSFSENPANQKLTAATARLIAAAA